MSFIPNGTLSPVHSSTPETGPFPSQGADFDADQKDKHLQKLVNWVDALTLRLGIQGPDAPFWGAHADLATRLNNLPGAPATHAGLAGLGADDHLQYHNDARGDARYYTQAQLNAGQLDGQYFQESEFIDISTGAPDVGKPVKLNAAGKFDHSLNDEVVTPAGAPDAGKLLALDGAGLIDHAAIDETVATTGAPDAGKLVALNGAGQFDPSVVPPSIAGKIFFPADFNADELTYKVKSVSSNGNSNFTFIIPSDFTTLTSLNLLYIVGTAISGNIDLESNYGTNGQGEANHNETNTISPPAFSPGNHEQYDISSVFSALAAGDRCGLNVDHQGIGGTLLYLGIEIVYT